MELGRNEREIFKGVLGPALATMIWIESGMNNNDGGWGIWGGRCIWIGVVGYGIFF